MTYVPSKAGELGSAWMVAARNAVLMRHAENSFFFVEAQAHKASSAKLIDESPAIPQCSFAAKTCMPCATSWEVRDKQRRYAVMMCGVLSKRFPACVSLLDLLAVRHQRSRLISMVKRPTTFRRESRNWYVLEWTIFSLPLLDLCGKSMKPLGLYLDILWCLPWFHFNIKLGYRCSSELLLNQCE